MRQLRETVLRFDGDSAVALLARAVREQGVTSTWETLVRPTLCAIAQHWTYDMHICLSAVVLVSRR